MKTAGACLVLVACLCGCLTPGADRPLHTAVQEGSLQRVRTLIAHGARINERGRYGRTPLYYAALYPRSEITAYLLEQGADPTRGASWKGNETPLHAAAEHGNLAGVQLLLNHAAPVDSRTFDGRTPLHLAASARQLSVAEYLLDHGADVNATDRSGYTPLSLPAGSSDKVLTNYQEMAECLVARGADVRHVDARGETALHQACYLNQAGVVRFFLEHGADPNARGVVGTPLEWAIQTGHQEIEDILRQHGARD